MDFGKEFEKFATKDQGINSMYYNKIISSMYPKNLTPNIIEERQMNIAIFDVFSRLMMDRIIFLGTAINDQVANMIQRNYSFWKVQMPARIFKFILTHQEVVFMPD